jgi:hypothetical protein
MYGKEEKENKRRRGRRKLTKKTKLYHNQPASTNQLP